MSVNTYESVFNSRYASREMLELFSADRKFRTWRKLWIALAESQKELGLDIKEEQLNELRAAADNINHEAAGEREKETRHDVMAHIWAYGMQCPEAKGIIHLGATSCYVGDNTDLIIMREAIEIIKRRLIAVIVKLTQFANQYKDMPALGYTHFQPAQPVTVGKRACLWIQDLILDVEEIEFAGNSIKFLGSKGTTGTQASFMTLFSGDHSKVLELEKKVAKKMGFDEDKVFNVSGQTYTRKLDSRILNSLAAIAQSSHKFSNDMRLLQGLKELEEPFEDTQVGSSAMAYKRNPMRSERMASLARYLISDTLNTSITASSQWLERSLDDSANRRISIPEGFLAADSILRIYLNIASGIKVYPAVIKKHLFEELPFMATENILMEAVKRGGDRQNLHERIRLHSMKAAETVKLNGAENDLIDRIAGDSSFMMRKDEIMKLVEPSVFTGRASQQTGEFIETCVAPFLEKYRSFLTPGTGDGIASDIDIKL